MQRSQLKTRQSNCQISWHLKSFWTAVAFLIQYNVKWAIAIHDVTPTHPLPTHPPPKKIQSAEFLYCISNLHEAQSAVHVRLKPSKQKNQWHQEKNGVRWVKGQGQSMKYTTNYILHNSPNSLTQSLPPSSLPPSLHLSSQHPLSLSLTDQQHRHQLSMKTKHTKTQVFQGIKVAQKRRSEEEGFQRSFELWEGTAVLDVGRKVVPDKGEPEQRMTSDQSPWVSILHRKEVFFIRTGTESMR